MPLRDSIERLALADACRFELRIAQELKQIHDLSDNPSTRELLAELIAEEEAHLSSLTSLLPVEKAAETVEIEPPASEKTDLCTMLRNILKKEESSVTFYELLAERTPIPAVKDAFRTIAEAEKKHVVKLAQHIRELCDGESG